MTIKPKTKRFVTNVDWMLEPETVTVRIPWEEHYRLSSPRQKLIMLMKRVIELATRKFQQRKEAI